MVTKSTGEREPFSAEKIMRTARRAGAKSKLAERIALEVTRRAEDGITTKKIFEIILEVFEREAPPLAARYGLSQALFRLGPAGFQFERYIAELLRSYGYETELPDILQGACITHEVDVLATREGRRAMIECKFRHERGIFIGIKDIMATWTRFLDLVDGAGQGKAPHLDECWVVTNSRFSNDALTFAHCKNMTLIAWNHPEDRGLSKMIDEQGLYPVTVLRSINEQTEQALAKGGVMLLRQLTQVEPIALSSKTGLPEELLRRLAHEAQLIIQHR